LCTNVVAGQVGYAVPCRAIWGTDRRPVNLNTVVPCASDRGKRSLTGARGIRLSTILDDSGHLMRTYTPKPGEITRTWHVIDATDVVLGRLASQTAILLRGKHKATFAPHVDVGDFVIIINADKVALTGAKLQQKKAYHHSGFPGGLKATSYTELLAKNPEKAIEKAVRGMLPRTTLGKAQLSKLKVYRGTEHPHAAQQPKPFEITQVAQ
jgi:large subunit ribosomal protein L13